MDDADLKFLLKEDHSLVKYNQTPIHDQQKKGWLCS